VCHEIASTVSLLSTTAVTSLDGSHSSRLIKEEVDEDEDEDDVVEVEVEVEPAAAAAVAKVATASRSCSGIANEHAVHCTRWVHHALFSTCIVTHHRAASTAASADIPIAAALIAAASSTHLRSGSAISISRAIAQS